MAEITKLLGFMSSWDRAATLEKYSALLDTYTDEEDIIEMLGTPTKLAIDLARDYVPTPPPAKPAAAEFPEEVPEEVSEEVPEEVPEEVSEEVSEEADAEETAPDPDAQARFAAVQQALVQQAESAAPEIAEAPTEQKRSAKRRVKPAASVFYAIACILIGLPVAILLIALGVPALMLGTGVIVTAVLTVFSILGSLSLISDILLLIGGALVAAAIGLLLLWLGLWISLELGWLWIGRALIPLGQKLCLEKEGEEHA